MSLNKSPELNNQAQHFFRIKLHGSAASEIILFELIDQVLEEDQVEVMIEKVGPGGLRFLSNLKLAVGQELIYSFEAELIEDRVHLPGEIIWDDIVSDGLYHYGVHFHIPENTRDTINHLLKDSEENGKHLSFLYKE